MTDMNQLQIVDIDISSVRPNRYNPNRMTPQQMDELRAEVDHLGRLPQPIQVRRAGEHYEIIDGEHRYTIAVAKGMKTVPCVIVDVDDFEARRQTFKMNRGGQDNRVLLGRMFLSMMSAKDISIRQLAREIEVPEATIRAHIMYAEAAEMRGRCAPDTAVSNIAKLKQHQVRQYLDLPESIRDVWLDGGADLGAFDAFGDWPATRVAHELHSNGLAGYLDATSPTKFRRSVGRLAALCHWCEKHVVVGIVDYLPAVAGLALPAEVLDMLPLERQGKSCRVLITPDAWRTALINANEHCGDAAGMMAMVEAAVRVALRDAGHDPANVCGPQVAEALQIVADGPEFIRAADFLLLKEQHYLVVVDLRLDVETAEHVKRRTVEMLREYRLAGGRERRKQAKLSVEDALAQCLREVRSPSPEVESLPTDADSILAALIAKLTTTVAVRDVTIDDLPAADVLAERLQQMDWPEVYLLAGSVLHADSAEHAAQMWLDCLASLGGEEEVE